MREIDLSLPALTWMLFYFLLKLYVHTSIVKSNKIIDLRAYAILTNSNSITNSINRVSHPSHNRGNQQDRDSNP